MIAPIFVAEHGDRAGRLDTVLFRRESAAQVHLDPQRSKVTCADEGGLRGLAERFEAEADALPKRNRHSGESAGVFGKIPELRDADALVIRTSAMLVDPEKLHDSRGVLHRPRPQGDGIEDRKEAGVQPDRRTQSEQCNQRESGRPAQIAHRVAEILPQAFEPRPDPYGARVFAGASDVSHGSAVPAHVAMMLDLLGELGFDFPLLQEIAQPPQESHARAF